MKHSLRLMHVLHGSSLPIGYPLAWWWHVWRGWRTSWCLRKVQPSKPQKPLEEPWRRSSGIGDQSWSPGRFLEQDAGRAAFGWEAQWISGIFWFHEEQQFLACNDGVSWLHQWLGHSYEQPWLPTVFVEPFHQWIFLQFAWYEPSCFDSVVFDTGVASRSEVNILFVFCRSLQLNLHRLLFFWLTRLCTESDWKIKVKRDWLDFVKVFALLDAVVLLCNWRIEISRPLLDVFSKFFYRTLVWVGWN